MNIENKEAITFGEFQAWLTGLIRGMDGKLPGIEEWKEIKTMMDKVAPEVVEVPFDRYPNQPLNPIPPIWPYTTPDIPSDKWPNRIWCSDGTISGTGGVGDTTTTSFSSSCSEVPTNGLSSSCEINSGQQLNLAIDEMIESNKT